MYKIQTLNKISTRGLDLLPREEYEVASDMRAPDAIMVRSQKMHDMELGEDLKAIARAGAGVNNVPVEKCTEKGVLVFNTPGANANSVKELVLAGLFLSSRKIVNGVCWVRENKDKGDELPALVEKNKKQFAGPEIMGKRLGVIGLGAIGSMVANEACALGMEVVGFDPFISVESAWDLSRDVQRAPGIESLLSSCDYITVHTPLNDKTRGFFDKDKFSIMKPGIRIMNFARGGLVDNSALRDAIDKGIVEQYVTDFPDAELAANEKVIPIPHLGASTPEAEENCAIMAAQQLRDFLENGNVTNSVNFPTCQMERSGETRLLVANKNIPNMVGQITAVLAEEKINIADFLNRHKDGIAYNIIDLEKKISDKALDRIKNIEGIIMVRLIGQ